MKEIRFFILCIVLAVIFGFSFSPAFSDTSLGIRSCDWNAPHLPDDDGDGFIDEDPIDGLDNDNDGSIDEDPFQPLCNWAACIDNGGGTFTCSDYYLKYYRNFDLLTPNTDITRAIIVVHGRRKKDITNEHTPYDYYEHILRAASDLGVADQTLIIAPFFDRNEKCDLDASGSCTCIAWDVDGNCTDDDVYNPKCGHTDPHPNPDADPDARLCWGGREENDYPGGGNADNDKALHASAFQLIDDMVWGVSNKKDDGTFPNLDTIVITGQSAGGQFTLRYAMAGTAAPTGITMRYVPCNPGAITFLDDVRPDLAAKKTFPNIGFQADCDGSSDQFLPLGATGRLADTEDWKTYPPFSYTLPLDFRWKNKDGSYIDCVSDNRYGKWPWGVLNADDANDYLSVNVASSAQLRARYLSRNVSLFFGIDDNFYVAPINEDNCGAPDGSSEWNCEHAIQGNTRVERGALFFNHVCCTWGCSNHEFATVCLDADQDGICDSVDFDPPKVTIPFLDNNGDGICERRLAHGGGIYESDAVRRAVFFGDAPDNSIQGWASTFGSIFWDTALSIQETIDGGYVMAGKTESFGAGGSDIWVVKLDNQGNVTWEKTYGGGEMDTVSMVIQTLNGGYILGGFTESFGAGETDIWILKLDADGNCGTGFPMTWQKTYGGLGSDSLAAIRQTRSDDGYILAGTTTSFGADANGDIWLLKLDSAGSVIWQNVYGAPGGGELAADIQEIPEGFIFAGETFSFGAGATDIWVMKLDQGGAILWEKTYGGEYLEGADKIIVAGDGQYIVTSRTESFALPTVDYHTWVLKLDVDGNIIWEKTYGTAHWDTPTDIKNTTDDCGYILSGYRKSGTLADAWLLKLDGIGNILWEKEFGGPDFTADILSSVQQTADGGYIAAGGTDSFGVGQRDAWVVRLDATGELENCPVIEKPGPGFSAADTSAAVADSNATVASTIITGSPTTAIPASSSSFQRNMCDPEPMVHLPRTGQTTPYYEGDDGSVQAGVPWPSPRFQDNEDGTVTDMLTGLMWLKDANCAGTIDHDPNETGDGSMYWERGFDFVTGINSGTHNIAPCSSYTGTYTDWRMANVNEIASLHHSGAANAGTWLNGQGFENVQPDYYWSSTHDATWPGWAWTLQMNSGTVAQWQISRPSFVWPVRAGQAHFPDPAYPVNIPKTGQTVSRYDRDDGDLRRGVAWPSSRFTDHGDGTVTDNLTGLMWLQDADCFGGRKWEEALDDVVQLNLDPENSPCAGYTAGHSDWYLANQKQIQSLLDRSNSVIGSPDPLPSGHPFLNFQAPLWSSTTLEASHATAWGYYQDGAMQFFSKAIYDNHGWPVRGGSFSSLNRDADLDRDGDVDGNDLSVLLESFGSSQGEPEFNGLADLVVDGVINAADLAAFAARFGRTNCPCL